MKSIAGEAGIVHGQPVSIIGCVKINKQKNGS